VVQWAIILIVAALVWPPTRRRIHRFVDRKAESIHTKLDALHNRHDEHDASLKELHRKLDHVIKHHPDIPALPRKR
jgi:F0F1-type ATP synthase membrane subunit b/b'